MEGRKNNIIGTIESNAYIFVVDWVSEDNNIKNNRSSCLQNLIKKLL